MTSPTNCARPPLSRLGVHVHGLADLHDPAVAHQREPVGQSQRLLLVVRDEDRRGTGVAQDQLDLPPEIGAQGRIEAREGLVEKHDLGLGRKGTRQRDTLALATGQLVRVAVGLVLKADELERALRLGSGAARHSEADVPLDGEMREERVVLEDHADPAALRRHPRAVARDDTAAHGHGASLRPLEACDQAQQGRLAGAGRPEDREDLAGPNLEGHVVDGLGQAKAARYP